MPATRVRVRPPHRHKGLFILWALYGISCGALFAVFMEKMQRVWSYLAFKLSGTLGFAAVPVVITLLLFTPPCCAALYMARCCQHRGPVYLSGQIVGTCYGIGIMIAILFVKGGPSTHTPWWGYLFIAGLIVGGGVFMGLIGLLFSAVYYHFVAVLVEQDGTLCVTCGYPAAHSPSDRCSECGTSRDTPMAPFGRIYRFADYLGHHARSLLYVVLVVLVGTVGVVIWHDLPVWRFTARFAGGRSPARAVHIPAGGYHPQTSMAVGIELNRGIAGGPAGAVLVIQQYRDTYFRAPRIQIRLAQWINLGVIGPWKQPLGYHQDGIPRIVCDLDADQTRHVMEHDIPEGLIDALVAAANEAGWTPMPTTGPWLQGKPDVVILPDVYFPGVQSD